jgi:hypothetical protein
LRGIAQRIIEDDEGLGQFNEGFPRAPA